MTAVALIVVNFNATALVRECLASAARDLGSRRWSAVIVDNDSAEPVRSALDGFPNTTLIENARNVGFGAAVNQAVRVTTEPLLLLLNPDCVVLPGAIDALDAALTAHADCAIAAPQLLNADGTTQASARGNPTAWTGLFGRHGLLARLLPGAAATRRNLPARDLAESNVSSAPIDWVMGAAMLIRRDAFEAVGGFDERYVLYWEDADLCRRLWARGLSTRYVPAARVIHSGGASARTQSARATWLFHRSAYLYYRSHVVTSPWHPMRWAALVALTARALLRMSAILLRP